MCSRSVGAAYGEQTSQACSDERGLYCALLCCVPVWADVLCQKIHACINTAFPWTRGGVDA